MRIPRSGKVTEKCLPDGCLKCGHREFSRFLDHTSFSPMARCKWCGNVYPYQLLLDMRMGRMSPQRIWQVVENYKKQPAPWIRDDR